MQTVLAIALGVLGSSGLAAIVVACLHRHWAKKDKKETNAEEMIAALEKKHEEDIRAIQEEQTLIVYGILAALKGLSEQGCNGPVTAAIGMIEKHLNKKAHHQH